MAPCKHDQHGSEMWHRPAHAQCDGCRALSVSEGASDFWICCVCLSLVCYDPASRRVRIAADRRIAKMDRTRAGVDVDRRRSASP